MVTADEIRDIESLRGWLEGRSKGDSYWIGLRTACRSLPNLGRALDDDWARKLEVSVLPVLRALLSSETTTSTAALKARGFGEVVNSLADDTDEYLAADAAYSVAHAAIARDRGTSLKAAIGFVARAADHSSFSAAATADPASARMPPSESGVNALNAAQSIWNQIREDARAVEVGGDLRRRPLWSGAVPNWFRASESEMRVIWQADPAMAFWLRWWDGALSGDQLAWDLQEKVALIEPEVWDAGPEAVAAEIARIEAGFSLDQLISVNPYAWRVDLDPQTKKFRAQPIERRDLEVITNSSRQNIKDFTSRNRAMKVGNFGEAVGYAFAPAINQLRRDLTRYRTAPLSLFKAIEAARTEMEGIAAVEGYANESYLTRFFNALASDAEDICVAAPEIVAQLKAKAAIRYELYSQERRREMALQTFGLYLDAEDILKRFAFEALKVIQDESATDAAKKDAFYFATAVLPRAARALLTHETENAGQEPKPSKSSRAKRLIDAADTLSKLDRAVDALQENIPEAYGWVQSIIDAAASNPPPAI
jgi:hypothetical protein